MSKKATLLFMAVLLMVCALALPAYADQTVKVVIDDESITFDVPPVIREGRTLVPVRKIVESMGGDVGWNAENQTVTVTRDGINIILVIDRRIAKVNEQDVVLDVPATLINGRTMIPLRFVSENINARVQWDPYTWTVSINTPVDIDDEAFELLLRASEKSKDVKKAKASLSGEMLFTSSDPYMSNMKIGFMGDMKFDSEAPAFDFNGKFTMYQGVLSQDINAEMVFKDYTYYYKDPFSGQWSMMEMSEEEKAAFEEALNQDSAYQIDYRLLYEKAKEVGAIRNLHFVEGQTLSGVRTTGVYVEINGLKMGALLKEALSNGYDETINEEIDELISDISFSKIKFTYWIGRSDDLIYGYDGEMRIGTNFSDEELGLSEEFSFEMEFSMVLSELNKKQVIIAPEVDETPITYPLY
ncbi:MAG: hypothetical protein CVU89_09700 [Firmicutes bacterium HGW-Firmicutes-14]|nr:MAG: hypothetical protein CVU89_09700 [Firmicutes bacterium HGW-Firmicutes-14]